MFPGVLDELDIALDDLREGQVPPAPKGGRSRTSDACDGGGIARVLDRDALEFLRRERLVAGGAIPEATQQAASRAAGGRLRLVQFFRKSSGERHHVRASQGGDRDFSMCAVNRDRFERRLFGQCGHNGTRETAVGCSIIMGGYGSGSAHQSASSLTHFDLRCDGILAFWIASSHIFGLVILFCIKNYCCENSNQSCTYCYKCWS